jgi:hypothetical protein
MPRSKIEVYWNTAETAPVGVIAQIRVTVGCGADYLLPYQGKFTRDGWVNATSGKPLSVSVTYWKPYVETPNNHLASDGRAIRFDTAAGVATLVSSSSRRCWRDERDATVVAGLGTSVARSGGRW